MQSSRIAAVARDGKCQDSEATETESIDRPKSGGRKVGLDEGAFAQQSHRRSLSLSLPPGLEFHPCHFLSFPSPNSNPLPLPQRPIRAPRHITHITHVHNQKGRRARLRGHACLKASGDGSEAGTPADRRPRPTSNNVGLSVLDGAWSSAALRGFRSSKTRQGKCRTKFTTTYRAREQDVAQEMLLGSHFLCDILHSRTVH